MLALMGERDAALALATEFDLTMANDNSPEQLVVAGPADRLDAARRAARPAGLRGLRRRFAAPSLPRDGAGARGVSRGASPRGLRPAADAGLLLRDR